MKQIKKEVVKKKMKTSDLLQIIKEEWEDTHNSSDIGEKINHLNDMMFGFIIYNLIRYDHSNYQKLFNNNKENEEGK